MMTRRSFVLAAAGTLGCLSRPGASIGREAIDRKSLVSRHSPQVTTVDPYSVLSVGNGTFVFTADATGLQTFPEAYAEIPLATQTEWGWHSFPNPEGYRLEDALVPYDTYGRKVPYASRQESNAGQWLRENPHRLSLARIGLDLHNLDNSPALASDLQEIRQRLDLWTGTLDSRFRYGEQRFRVRTWAHPNRDLLAVHIESGGDRPLAVTIAFPYGARIHTGNPADWTQPGRHRTEVIRSAAGSADIRRTLDDDQYYVRARWTEQGTLSRRSDHQLYLEWPSGVKAVDLVVAFTPDASNTSLPGVAAIQDASARHWQQFWSTGGALDLGGSTDPRAHELERRIVLSQYLTAIQCSGSMPPQETGLTFNSWHGKHHLEMHWWHAAHFALWNRPQLLSRSLPWYRSILDRARGTARMQGYTGARWPKMVGPDGRESPSGVGPFLIWQQPHPIYLAELVYRAQPDRRFLEDYREVVFETATFMASYPVYDRERQHYVLGPPLIPAQEIHRPETTFNPTFELSYWAFGLETAQQWRRRLGLARDPEWDRVLRGLAPLPMRDGLYLNAESDPDTFIRAEMRRDHPTLLGALGFVPSQQVNPEAMRRTLHRVMRDWQWQDTWGWDYPLVAMTAARVGEPEIALDALLMDTPKNRYHPNGHNYQRPGLTIYLPGNGGLLSAVAMMAAGWDKAPITKAPGFPRSGWHINYENLLPLP